MLLRRFWFIAFLVFHPFAINQIRAEDWPGWRGLHRNGIAPEAVATDRMDSLRVLWRAAVGKGHSAISVSNGRAFTLGWDGRDETVFCFDAKSGALQWKFSYSSKGVLQWPGPRSTPAVDEGRVYTLNQDGQIHCLDATNGAKNWTVRLPSSYQPDGDYGFPWSPLLHGDLVIFNTGSRGLALRKKDGSFAWGNDGQAGACVSAIPYKHDGRSGVIVVSMARDRNSISLVGVDPKNGTEQWRSPPWPEKWGAAATDLIVQDGKIFVSTAEQHKRCARFSLNGTEVKEDWSNRDLVSYTGGAVLLGGHLYGVDKIGALKCLDWETGAEKWAQRGFGEFGTLIGTRNDLLLVQNSRDGTLTIVAAEPGGYRALHRAKLFNNEPGTFTAPVLANGKIYVRSYAGEVVCAEVDRK